MTDQHPLTDDVLKQIGCENPLELPCLSISGRVRVFGTQAMRTAYDLGRDEHLEKVITAWEQCLESPRTDIQDLLDFGQKLKAMRPEKDGFVEGRNYLANRVAELEKALNELMDVCAECDSWESFPSRPLDKAHSVLNK